MRVLLLVWLGSCEGLLWQPRYIGLLRWLVRLSRVTTLATSADRSAYRWRGLSRTERRDPGRCSQGCSDLRRQFVGFPDGWRGPLDGDAAPLDISDVRGILPRGGTILGSSRTNPYNSADGERRVLDTVERLDLDALIVIGGEDTLGVATKLTAAGLG